MKKIYFLLVFSFWFCVANAQVNASADSIFFYPSYTQMPAFQVSPFNWTVVARNMGINSIDDLSIKFTLNNGTTDVFAPSPSHNLNVASGSSVSNNFGNFLPSRGSYTVKAVVNTGSQTDQNPTNDIISYNMLVTDTVMARDNGNITLALGMLYGTGVTMGQIFELPRPAFVTSITFFCYHSSDSTNAGIYTFNSATGPGSLLNSTYSHVFTSGDSANGVILTLPFIGGPMLLPAGTYFVGVKQYGQHLYLGTTDFNFQPRTTWAGFASNWGPLEDLGYNITFFLRLNMYEKYNTIKGSCFVDFNNNSLKDIGEPGFTNVSVISQDGAVSFSTTPSSSGFFSNFVVDTGNIITTLKNLKYYSYSPLQHASVFNSYYNVDSVDFALTPISIVQDLRITILPLSPLRTGRNANYRIQYSNIGTDTMSGTVYLIKDARTIFVSSTPAQISISGDTITWSYTNLLPNESRTIDITLLVALPPTVNVGDLLNTVAVIEPVATDTTPADNRACVCEQPVVGSYDPNDKAMLGGSKFAMTQVTDGEYMSYMVRFQNTGNDTAFTVIIRDTLDNKLDGGTLEIVSSSHPCRLAMLNEKYISWTFDNILLPDSNVDELNSHGYVAYRIKPKSTVITNDEIRNTAYIYFDYNAPVKTNTVITTITESVITGVRDIAHDGLVVYPNPSGGRFTIVFNDAIGNASIKIFNMLGTVIKQAEITTTKTEVDLSSYPAGIYFLQVNDGDHVYMKKVLVQ